MTNPQATRDLLAAAIGGVLWGGVLAYISFLKGRRFWLRFAAFAFAIFLFRWIVALIILGGVLLEKRQSADRRPKKEPSAMSGSPPKIPASAIGGLVERIKARPRRSVIWVAVALAALMILIPPWTDSRAYPWQGIRVDRSRSLGYEPLFVPPEGNNAQPDVTRLVLQLIALALVAGAAWWSVGPDPEPSERDEAGESDPPSAPPARRLPLKPDGSVDQSRLSKNTVYVSETGRRGMWTDQGFKLLD